MESGTAPQFVQRVAFVVASDVLGGHEMQTAELVKLVAGRCAVKVFLNDRRHAGLFAQANVPVEVSESGFFRRGKLPLQIMRGLASRRRYTRLFSGFDRVIVCAGAVEAGMQVGFGLLLSGKADLYLPFVYDRRVQIGWLGGLYTCLLHVLTNLFENIITINRIQARLMSRAYLGRLHIVPNYVAPPPPLGHTAEPARLITIGRLDTQKQMPELIDALDYPQNPFSTLLVIGDGPLREDVEGAASRARHIRVLVLGWLDAKQQSEVLGSDDILVVNSLIEGEPTVIREANARGLLVLARNIPGVRGVTRKANRFSGVEELRAKLIEAKARAIKLVSPADASVVSARRRLALERLFGPVV